MFFFRRSIEMGSCRIFGGGKQRGVYPKFLLVKYKFAKTRNNSAEIKPKSENRAILRSHPPTMPNMNTEVAPSPLCKSLDEKNCYVRDTPGVWIYRRADGGVMKGPVMNGKPHGGWTHEDPSGFKGGGQFVNGKRHGTWLARAADGRTKIQEWENGKLKDSRAVR